MSRHLKLIGSIIVSSSVEKSWIQWKWYLREAFSEALFWHTVTHRFPWSHAFIVYSTLLPLSLGPNSIIFCLGLIYMLSPTHWHSSTFNFGLFSVIDRRNGCKWSKDCLRRGHASWVISVKPKTTHSIPPIWLDRFSREKLAIFRSLMENEDFRNICTFGTQWQIRNKIWPHHSLDRGEYWIHQIKAVTFSGRQGNSAHRWSSRSTCASR
jgi:hypothetical protein